MKRTCRHVPSMKACILKLYLVRNDSICLGVVSGCLQLIADAVQCRPGRCRHRCLVATWLVTEIIELLRFVLHSLAAAAGYAARI